MIERTSAVIRHRVLLAHEAIEEGGGAARALMALEEELLMRDIDMVKGSDDSASIFSTDASLHGVLVSWTLPGALELIQVIRKRNGKIPIFLLIEREDSANLSKEILTIVSELIWLFEDSLPFIAGRIEASIHLYSSNILGPMAKALLEFDHIHEYSWHTPGHTGGTAFQKAPAGRLFFDYFGENLFRSDLSISVGELGSLLDHSGPIGEGEKYAARVFGADRTYCVTNGTSTSNRIIWMASVCRGQLALVDRNCHKSTEHGLTLTGAIPQYLMPTRNQYGIIGPIPPEHLVSEAIHANGTPVHCVITNSTYDGLTYNVDRVLELIGDSVDRIHFDEAWYAYARFHPLYRGRHAMRKGSENGSLQGPTLFATHSTHKLLAALSQASFIHIKDGRNSIDHARFNESFMMHASTSPLYTIIASNDVTTSMMDGPGGEALMDEAIRDAIAFRQLVTKLWREHADSNDWFFQTWNPTEIEQTPFEQVSPDRLACDPSCWVLHPNDEWHGFHLEDDYCMLDPIKVQVVTTPGNFPAGLLTAYLDAKGIEVEKTNDYSILFLFSIGVTNAKWSTLLHQLLAFKQDFDANLPLTEAIPAIANFYPGLGLKDLGKRMQDHMVKNGTLDLQAKAFSKLPTPTMIPADAYQRLLANAIQRIPLNQAAGRTAATGLVPYPPGIPLIMPGENIGSADEPFMKYLLALEAWDKEFPGFAHDTHGIEPENGVYHLLVLK
ncbi:MAG: Orn/Lys/Arg decarboxylase N-terminal domain-containing protein [Myxococcota bacterium]